MSEVFEYYFNELVTKADLKNEINLLREDMNKMMLQMTVRMGGMIAAGIAVLIALKQF